MKSILTILAVMLIFSLPVCADVVIGGAIGTCLSDVQNPGGIITIGMETSVGTNNVVRFTLNKLNFGDSNAVFDNVSGTDINYFLITSKWPNTYFGLRLSADYETQDADLGLAIGGEWLQKNKFLFFIPSEFCSSYANIDLVNRNDQGDGYIQIGAGLKLLE